MTFIERLLMLMQAKGLTAYRLAKEVGISESLISKWQKNPNADPSSTILCKLCEYFQVSMKWLLTGEDEIPKAIPEIQTQPPDLLLMDERTLLNHYRKMNDTTKEEYHNLAVSLLVAEQSQPKTKQDAPKQAPTQTKPVENQPPAQVPNTHHTIIQTQPQRTMQPIGFNQPRSLTQQALPRPTMSTTMVLPSSGIYNEPFSSSNQLADDALHQQFTTTSIH